MSTLSVGTIQSNTSAPPVIQNSSGTEIGQLCKAWVNFGYVASAIVVRSSFNVTSVTRNGTGDYTVTYTNNMPDANYAMIGTASDAASAASAPALSLNVYNGTTGQTASSVRVVQEVSTGAANDRPVMCVAVFR